ncbi:MAG: AAA family ATPase [Endomicrobium sp.]|jgi:hypothetical protein|nr:AAA family ATPase [Endomicrobium sp.]
MELKQFPLGNQSFDEIIDENLVYADKTKYIYDLLNSKEQSFFLSRPRRFGKSILLSTICELFTGNPERFKELWIGGSDYDFPKLPVIHLSMAVDSMSSEALEKSILCKLKTFSKRNNLDVDGDDTNEYFIRLIQAASKIYKSKVVVLIDEYDAPVNRRMNNLKLAQANADVLHDFFATLKEPQVSTCVRFTLVTGITRYALNSKDSYPNHLVDISLDPNYAGICCFTLDDFDSLFSDRLGYTFEELKKLGRINAFASIHDLKASINYWYDGYNWGGETRVLNPYTILFFFRNNAFTKYWIQSGQPRH